MELAEAKEIIKSYKERLEYVHKSVRYDENGYKANLKKSIEAVDTILQELDNSISKDKIREKIEEIQSTIQVYGGFTAGKMVEYYRKLGKLEALKDLLEE